MEKNKTTNSSENTGTLFAGFLQFDVKVGAVEENLAGVRRGIAELNPGSPGIVVLPELWATGFDYDRLPELAEKTPGLLAELQSIAAERGIHLAGSLPEAAEGRYYNTLFVAGPQGTCGAYRKQFLFAPMGEDMHFSPGKKPQPVDTVLGKLACLVCYDLRFPQLVQHQACHGAEVLLVSAQWPAARREHWQLLVRARAVENQMFVVACNRCGQTGNTRFGGHSLIVAPDGEVLAAAENNEAFVGATIETDWVEAIRERFNTVGPSRYPGDDQAKITGLPELKELIAGHKKIGRKVVFTNGCFDILHQGHVTYLEAARQQGDCLVVGLNNDDSVRAIKGPDRPVNHEKSRARVLAGLGCVDHVVLFSEDTPLNLIQTLMPDILVKGADWPVDQIVGAKEVLGAGGEVETITLVEDFSTTAIIKKVQLKDV